MFLVLIKREREGERRIQDFFELSQGFWCFSSVFSQARWCNVVRVKRLWMVDILLIVDPYIVYCTYEYHHLWPQCYNFTDCFSTFLQSFTWFRLCRSSKQYVPGEALTLAYTLAAMWVQVCEDMNDFRSS